MDSVRQPIRRNRRTRRQMLFDACCAVPDHRPTRDELRALLPQLTDDQFIATLQKALDDPEFPLEGAPGGRYYGTEGTGSVGRVGLYGVVATKLEQGGVLSAGCTTSRCSTQPGAVAVTERSGRTPIWCCASDADAGGRQTRRTS